MLSEQAFSGANQNATGACGHRLARSSTAALRVAHAFVVHGRDD